MDRSFSDIQLLGGLFLVALLAIAGSQARFLRLRRALGIEQLLASSFLFLPLGMLLSEAGLGIIHAAVVREFEPLVTLGLGVLGLLLGLRLDGRRLSREGTVLVRTAGVESLFTLLLVSVPTFFLLEMVGSSVGARASAAALLGCAAAISGRESLHAAARTEAGPTPVTRVADYGTVAGVLAAGILLALLTPTETMGSLEKLLALAGIGTIGGLSAWLLASDTRHQALRTTLLMGVLLSTAGTSVHLGLPPVAATLIAGIAIAHMPGTLARELRNNLKFLESPLTVLLLVIAGAAMQVPGLAALVVLVLFLLLRTAGKILGGYAASRVMGGVLPAKMGLGLLPSSAVALGLALDYRSSGQGELGDVVMTTVILGSLLSETAGVWTTRLLARANTGVEVGPGGLPSIPDLPLGTDAGREVSP